MSVRAFQESNSTQRGFKRLTALIVILLSLGIHPQVLGQALETSAEESLLAALHATVVDASYDRVDFERVIQDLRERHNLNIHASWAGLEAAGVRRDRRIEAHLRGVSLATLLNIILREVGAGASQPVTYYAQDGVLIIATGDLAREETVLRSYEVADLIESGYSIRRFANTPVLGLDLTGREFVGGEIQSDSTSRERSVKRHGGSGGGSTFGEPNQNAPRLSEMERIQILIDLVTGSIELESWDVNGGDVGSIRVFGSTLLIRHTIRAHQRIADFLALLRSSRPVALDADAAVVRLRTDKAAQWRQRLGRAFPRLSVEQVDEIAYGPSVEGVLFRGSVSGFNGQRLWISALEQREVVTAFEPIVAQQTSAFSPISSTATSGLELIVLPLLAPNDDHLTVDVQMAWVLPPAVTQRPVILGPAAETSVDQSLRLMRTVSSSTNVKLGEAIALSLPTTLDPQGQAAEWEDWLIIRVREPGT